MRVVGKTAGAWLGAVACRAEPAVRNWMGVALLPQAGVAIGLALVGASRFPEYKQTILTIIISTTILFEIAGPVFTRLALRKAWRAESQRAHRDDAGQGQGSPTAGRTLHHDRSSHAG